MTRFFIIVAGVFVLMSSGTTFAQNELTDLLGKRDFLPEERMQIEEWVREKTSAAGRARQARLRQRIFADIQKNYEEQTATEQFRRLYTEACGREFRQLLRHPDFMLAHEAILLLLRMPEPGISPALMEALGSPQAAIRYQAAKGLRNLHAKFTDAGDVTRVLNALTQAAATETDPNVIDILYQAISFSGAGNNFTAHDEVAQALLAVLGTRLVTLTSTPRDEWADLTGLAAAGSTYAKLPQGAVRLSLIETAAQFLALYARRYADLGPQGGGLGLLAPVETCEQALERMIRATPNAPSPPNERLAQIVRDKGEGPAAITAAARWIGAPNQPGVLNGEPWNLPIGLRE
jgi:hypothetical protein